MKKAAFVAVVNGQYLPGFHALLYSLRRTGSLEDFDVVAVTTERKLNDDPIIREICKDVIVVTDVDIARFRTIPDEGVKEDLRRPEIAKYNFLKFYAFRDLGYDYNVLIDCDIVCLRKIAMSDVCFEDVDLAVAPRFSPSHLYPANAADEGSQDETEARMERFWKEYAAGINETGINSGVTVVGRKLMDDAVFSAMIDLAASMSAGGDQSVIWKFIRRGTCVFRPLHPSYNFNQHALGHLSALRQAAWIDRAVLLHYPGSYPWEGDATMKRVSHALWHRIYQEANVWRKTLKS